MTHQQVMTHKTSMTGPQWINNIYIGPFWMGTPEQIAETQAAIDEECALYEEAATHDDDIDWIEGEYDEIQPGF